MRVFDERGDTPFLPKDKREKFIDMLIRSAKERGYDGITLAACASGSDSTGDYGAFIVEMRKRLIGCDLILFTELDLNRDGTRTDYSDANVLMYSKCQLEDIPSFEDGERAVFNEYANSYESSKAFIDLPAFAYGSGEAIEIKEALTLAHRERAKIENDEERKLLSFDYTRFRGTKGETGKMRFESLENIKAKLELIAELGYMGVSFDVSRTPVSTLMMVHTMFARSDMFGARYDDM